MQFRLPRVASCEDIVDKGGGPGKGVRRTLEKRRSASVEVKPLDIRRLSLSSLTNLEPSMSAAADLVP